jgi:lysophospholipase L1-like esterase
MMDCLILGDSIAHGLGNELRDCIRVAEIGINTRDFLDRHGENLFITEKGYNKVIISLGSNDAYVNKASIANLRRLRSRVHGKEVYWILPSEKVEDARNAVEKVAMDNQDHIIIIPSYSQDKIHPNLRGYQDMAKAVR